MLALAWLKAFQHSTRKDEQRGTLQEISGDVFADHGADKKTAYLTFDNTPCHDNLESRFVEETLSLSLCKWNTCPIIHFSHSW